MLLKSGVYTPESFIEEENRLNDKLSELKTSEDISDVSMQETMKDIVKLSELLKSAYSYYSFADSREKEQIIRIIFSELFVSGNTFKYNLKKGFEPFEKRLLSVCDSGGI